MKLHRPSPALVVSIVALIVALGGTAVATTRLLISSTSQIKNGAVTGKDIRHGTITSHNLSSSLLKHAFTGSSAGAPAAAGTEAIEAHRQAGPSLGGAGGKATVATLQLPPGVYAVSATVNLTPNIPDQGLLDAVLRSNKTVVGDCTLDVAGTGDYTAGSLVSPGSENPLSLSMQVTRTLAQTAPATLTCEAADTPWKASDASIIAIRVASSTRTEVSG